MGVIRRWWLVGGHAVNLWSAYFLARGVGGLAEFLPFTSKDLDVVGTADLLNRLNQSPVGTIKRSEPRSPVIGRLEIPREDGNLLLIEVLHMVLGLNKKELGRAMEIRTHGLAARVLLPQLILKAKIENTARIPQEGRNDVKHVKMMILSVRAFIMETVEAQQSGQVSARGFVNLLEDTHVIISSPAALKAAKMWDFDFSKVLPLEELRATGDGKIGRWLEHRFPD